MSGIGTAAQNVPAATLISLRRPAIISGVIGALGIVAGIVFGHIPMGFLFVIGLGMGLFNARLLQRNTVKVISSENPTKRALMGSSALRLMLFTLVALGLGYFVQPDGLGVFIGLAIFQFIFMANTMIPVMKEYRRQ